MEVAVGYRILGGLLLALLPIAPASGVEDVPPEVLAGKTCEEHIVQKAEMTPKDIPKAARGWEYSAVVIVSFRLDGSGKALDPKVVHAKPERLFEKTTLALLDRTRFAPGAVEDACYFLRTYSAVRRRSGAR
jgi:hypothetical protein